MRWRESDGVRWLEAELPGARAAFSARSGGVSEGPFESLNLGILTGDEPNTVIENRSRLAAAIGPGIGPCCYEVGTEVRDTFARLGDGVTAGRALDLAEVARRLLREAGVERIESAGLCTSCEEGSFFSHRRDAGETGRQAGLTWLDDGEGLSR